MASRISDLRGQLDAHRQAQWLLRRRNRMLRAQFCLAQSPRSGIGLVVGGALLGMTCCSMLRTGYPQSMFKPALSRWLNDCCYRLLCRALPPELCDDGFVRDRSAQTKG